MRKEIRLFETQDGMDRQYYSNSEFLDGVLKWDPNPGNVRGRKKQLLNSFSLHQQMLTFLRLVLKDKQVYN